MSLLGALVLSLGTNALPPAEECTLDPAVWQLVLEADAIQARAGERIALHWTKTDGQHGSYMPRACLTGWEVSDPALAALSADRYALTISPAAAPGSTVTVSVLFGGRRTTLGIRVLAPEEPVLTGVWQRSSAAHCVRPPAELWFGANGRYSYTFPEQMLETMQSGSGDYDWDWRTGAIRLDRLHGHAERRGDNLTTQGLDFALGAAESDACVIQWRAGPPVKRP